ncbi:MAG: NAD(P)H-hydrate dehydratase [Pedobacter sp.]|nr:MAG: NAD(P)H-hydrate dehydratase [Pedobacter sp.]
MAIYLSDYLPDTDDYSLRQVVARGLDKGEENRHPFQLIESEDISRLFKPRLPFSHKGTYGHALLIAGSEDTMGAALISAKACLHAGAGLITLSMPGSGLVSLNTSLPEVMYIDREKLLQDAGNVLKKFQAVAIGPGLGKDQKEILTAIIATGQSLIADADALNMLAEQSKLLQHLPKNSILTPHMKEFDTLFGPHKTWWDRLQTASSNAKEYGIVIVLKNERTFIIDQKGVVFINPTGNPAMAQGGMGDALTGIITAFVAQGYEAKTAAILGVYFHGKAGDELAKDNNSVTASEVTLQLSKTIKRHP